MNRYIKITLFTLVCFCFNINKMYACDQDPIPVMTSNPNAYKIFMNVSDSRTFNSNSYDPDDGDPQGSNNGIQKYNWDIYSYSSGYLEPRYRNVNSSFTFSPSALGLGPGRYDIELNVLDDDHEDELYNYINGYNYYSATGGDWRGIRSIYVIGIDYFRDQWDDDEHYLPYGTGETFVYSLLPGPGSNWEPDVMCLYIKDAGGNYAYMRYLFGSVVNDPNIPLGGSEAYLEWNGLGNQGSYKNQPLPPGNYTVTLYINKSGYTAYETNPLTITVIELMGVTNATQTNVTGSKNWASVKNVGNDVIVEAFFYPTIPDAYVPYILEWEGGSPVDGNPRQRKVSKSTSDHYNVTATAGSSSDYVDIYILWATGTIRVSNGKSPGNNVDFTNFGYLTNTLGPKTDEDDGETIGEACGIIEIVFTLYPSGIYDVISSGWDIKRWITYHDFENGSTDKAESRSDDSHNTDEDLVPDSDDKIYVFDGPTIPFGINHTFETYNNFREWVEWNGVQCSGDYYWYYQARVDDDLDAANKPNNDDTELNDVNTGQITPLPSSATYQTR